MLIWCAKISFSVFILFSLINTIVYYPDEKSIDLYVITYIYRLLLFSVRTDLVWATWWLSYVWPFLVFDTFLYGVLGQVWYLIFSIHDRCLLPSELNLVTNMKTALLRAGCFKMFVFPVSCNCYCSVAFPHSPVGRFAVCACSSSWSYSLTFLNDITKLYFVGLSWKGWNSKWTDGRPVTFMRW